MSFRIKLGLQKEFDINNYLHKKGKKWEIKIHYDKFLLWNTKTDDRLKTRYNKMEEIFQNVKKKETKCFIFSIIFCGNIIIYLIAFISNQ